MLSVLSMPRSPAQQRAERAALRNAAGLRAPPPPHAHDVGLQVLSQQVEGLLPADSVINHLQESLQEMRRHMGGFGKSAGAGAGEAGTSFAAGSPSRESPASEQLRTEVGGLSGGAQTGAGGGKLQ